MAKDGTEGVEEGISRRLDEIEGERAALDVEERELRTALAVIERFAPSGRKTTTRRGGSDRPRASAPNGSGTSRDVVRAAAIQAADADGRFDLESVYDLVPAPGDGGVTRNRIRALVGSLCDNGVIERVGHAKYRVVDGRDVTECRPLHEDFRRRNPDAPLARDIVLRTLGSADGPVSLKTLEQASTAHGHAASGMGSVLSSLIKRGLIARPMKAHYVLAPTSSSTSGSTEPPAEV